MKTMIRVLMAAFCLLAATPSALAAFLYGVQYLNHNDHVTFRTPFDAPPVVITSAQLNCVAVSSVAVSQSSTGFDVLLTDHQGRDTQAWVEWIAFQPDLAMDVIGGVIDPASAETYIPFSNPLSATPVIIVNGVKDGKALIAGVASNTKDGFWLTLDDDQGIEVTDARVYWMAVVPKPANGFKGAVYRKTDGVDISFSPAFLAGPAYLLCGKRGIIAGAINNRKDGFLLTLVKHNGLAAEDEWTSWLGFAGLEGVDTQPPTWPAGAMVTATEIGTTSVTLTWPVASDNVEVTHYYILNQFGLVVGTTTGATFTYTVTGLDPKTQYVFGVEASDGTGLVTLCPASAIVQTAADPDVQAPTWPAGSITASDIDSTRCTLEWSAAADNVAVTQYRVYCDGNLCGIVDANQSRRLNAQGLTGNTHYTFTVQAGDATGNWSSTGPSVPVTTVPKKAASLVLWAATNEPWASTYTVTGVFTNSGQVDITEVTISLYEDGNMVTPAPMTRTSRIPPDGDFSYAPKEFKKNWQWWADPEIYAQWPLPPHLPGPLNKEYGYHVEATWKYADGTVETGRCPSAGYESIVNVYVSQQKLDDAAWAYRGWGTDVAASVCGWLYRPAKLAFKAIELLEHYCYNDYVGRLKDPPEFDPDFRIVPSLPNLPLDLTSEGTDSLSVALQDTAYSLRDFAAATHFFNQSRTRAWTAFAFGDEVLIHQQVDANATARGDCITAARSLSDNLFTLADEIDAAGIDLTEEDVMGFQQQVQNEGLPQDEVDLLGQWGAADLVPQLKQLILLIDPAYASQLSQNLRAQATLLAMMVEGYPPTDPWFDEVQLLGQVHSARGRQQLLFAAGFLTLEEIELGRTKLTPLTISAGTMRFLPSGEFQMDVSGGPGHVFVLQRSTDLLTWSPVSTITVPSTGNVVVRVLPRLPLRAEFFRCAGF